MTHVMSVATALSLAATAVFAQPPVPAAPGAGRAGRGGGTPATALRSPEVNADRTVTLRFRAPQATQVDVVGEIMQGAGPRAMVKGDDGVWSATIGPLPPEIWSYNFRVQGIESGVAGYGIKRTILHCTISDRYQFLTDSLELLDQFLEVHFRPPIATTLSPPIALVAQNLAQASIIRRRFSTMSPRR